MIISIGSKNPAKIKAVLSMIDETRDELVAVDVSSGVADQPFSDEETIQGAINRAWASLEETRSEMGIGLEGGVTKTAYGLMLCNWGALVKEGEKPIIAGGARIPIPKEVEARLLQGEELGPIMADFTQRLNVSKREGAIGVFTNNKLTRSQMFEHIISMLFGQCDYQSKDA
ncbi:DUF84 family protein [Bacillus testis]|uniref:DUF84 family protein n=1 Tax=Bacillus testis TaxID=1622072 RepID=UPI00067EA78C|nr:DUF84 family protein [Bacillus testis]